MRKISFIKNRSLKLGDKTQNYKQDKTMCYHFTERSTQHFGKLVGASPGMQP